VYHEEEKVFKVGQPREPGEKTSQGQGEKSNEAINRRISFFAEVWGSSLQKRLGKRESDESAHTGPTKPKHRQKTRNTKNKKTQGKTTHATKNNKTPKKRKKKETHQKTKNKQRNEISGKKKSTYQDETIGEFKDTGKKSASKDEKHKNVKE